MVSLIVARCSSHVMESAETHDCADNYFLLSGRTGELAELLSERGLIKLTM